MCGNKFVYASFMFSPQDWDKTMNALKTIHPLYDIK